MVSRSLFFSDDLSPSPLHQKGDDDVADVFFGSPCRWVDEGSRDSGYSSPNNQVLTPSPKRISYRARRSLFPRKRLRDEDHVEDAVVPKRVRLPATTSEICQRLEGEGHLIGDGSKEYSLPTVDEGAPDLTSISPKTLTELMTGVYDDISSFQIIDCRYPYEFEGGHIQGAVNVYTKQDVENLLRSQSGALSHEKKILIFHCEFSSQRAPKLLRHLRNADRQLNKDQYPKLLFPEIYLLSGGYKSFFAQCQDCCTPMDYVPMLHKEHADDLRHFRSRTKSWTAGQSKRVEHFRSLRTSLSFDC